MRTYKEKRPSVLLFWGFPIILYYIKASEVPYRVCDSAHASYPNAAKPYKKDKRTETVRLSFLYSIYYPQPNTESRKPAAIAEPMTPATLGPIACMSR